jgi:hypothetical protein
MSPVRTKLIMILEMVSGVDVECLKPDPGEGLDIYETTGTPPYVGVFVGQSAQESNSSLVWKSVMQKHTTAP